MGNCLVTKLKSAVDNDDLLKIGEMRIKSSQSAAFDVPIACYEPNSFTIKNVGNVNVSVDGVTLAPSESVQRSNTTITMNENAEIVVSNIYKYYSYREFGHVDGDVSDLRYIGASESVNADKQLMIGRDGDLSCLANKSLIGLGLWESQNTHLYEAIFGNISTLQSVTIRPRDADTTQYITLEQIATIPNLRTVVTRLNSCVGALEDYVSIMRVNGIMSGNMTFGIAYETTGLTYAGKSLQQHCAEDYETPYWGDLVLSWTANSISLNKAV